MAHEEAAFDVKVNNWQKMIDDEAAEAKDVRLRKRKRKRSNTGVISAPLERPVSSYEGVKQECC